MSKFFHNILSEFDFTAATTPEYKSFGSKVGKTGE